MSRYHVYAVGNALVDMEYSVYERVAFDCVQFTTEHRKHPGVAAQTGGGVDNRRRFPGFYSTGAGQRLTPSAAVALAVGVASMDEITVHGT